MHRPPQSAALLRDFEPRGEASVLGVTHIGLQNPDNGTNVIMPADKYDLLRRDQGISSLVGHIATGADVRNGSNGHSVEVLKHAQTGWGEQSTARVYANTRTNTVIKAFEDSRSGEPLLQYAVMAGLAKALNSQPTRRSGITLRAAEQYALVSPTTANRQTIIMDRVRGTSAQTLIVAAQRQRGADRKGLIGIKRDFIDNVEGAVSQQVPRGLRPYLNDITHHNGLGRQELMNLYLDGSVEDIPDATHVTIIDQPGMTTKIALKSRLDHVERLGKLLR